MNMPKDSNISEQDVREVMQKLGFGGYKVDFTYMHPLDHFIGTRRCHECYGGPRRHVQLFVEYKLRDHKLIQVFAPYVCRMIGKHKPMNFVDAGHGSNEVIHYGVVCMRCGAERLAEEY